MVLSESMTVSLDSAKLQSTVLSFRFTETSSEILELAA